MMNTTTIDREVPATTLTLKLKGTTVYGAPIQELLMAATMYSVEDVVEVSLTSGERYVVRGDLFEDKRAIWLENASTGERVGKSIQPK